MLLLLVEATKGSKTESLSAKTEEALGDGNQVKAFTKKYAASVLIKQN